MRKPPDPHYRRRFPAEVISHAVWLYHVFSLSFRDVELILAERGVIVSYESIRRWCLTFGASFASNLRRHRPRPGGEALLQTAAEGSAVCTLRPDHRQTGKLSCGEARVAA
jgi:putative transposase